MAHPRSGPRRRSASRAAPLLLAVAVAAGAAFERGPFPDLPSGSVPLSANPASLGAVVRSACGQLGHDLPFGLRELAGHHLLAAGRLGPLRPGFGAALRGPARFRERAWWVGAGLPVARGLRIGAAVQGLSVRGTDGPGWRRRAPVVGVRWAVGRDWGLEAWVRGRAGKWVARRAAARWVYSGRDGSLSLGALSSGRRLRFEFTLAKPMSAGAAVGLEVIERPRQLGLTATLRRSSGFGRIGVRSHRQLGATPSWVVGWPCGEPP